MVAYFKYQTTKRVNELRSAPANPLWQRNYYEHVIRSDDDLHQIRNYIEANPSRWMYDENNPINK